MKTDITKELCLGCGEEKPEGLIPTIMHSCALNQITYTGNYSNGYFWRSLHDLFGRKGNRMQSFENLLLFPHFKPIETISHPLDEMLYSHARLFEIKQMKRLRNWIEIEQRFDETH